jgi:hypothetical protein
VVLSIKGGFGNQLFQYATAYALAKRLNVPLYLETSFFQNEKFEKAWRIQKFNVDIQIKSEQEIAHLKSIPTSGSLWKRIVRKLPIYSPFKKKTHWLDLMDFVADSRFFKLEAPVLLEGWFLKPTYFKKEWSALCSIFSPAFPLSYEANMWIDQVRGTESVAIHVRRTDYVNNPMFVNLDEDYYKRSIGFMASQLPSPRYFVFSDDLPWCRDLFKKMGLDCEFVQCEGENSDIEDFEVMRACRHQVIANSSYSWWAAFLNANSSKLVVTPAHWYRDENLQQAIERNDDFWMDSVRL